ncbi:hypothetical protein L6164_001377 [Bauhinia variegata]|uniref:Uncharacterized protein n=1 Tax=Bauhinia variegata TaxID=167791 RepID=A0ACB9QAQ3_BAUVA|nr:hypothetical protein L6164_001377 [Bauhinia variegata]
MELESVLHFLKGKTFLFTGATGFIAKIFVEKVLRVQPEVKRLYILVRAPNSYLATKRLHNEVIRKDLFGVLRDKWGADFGCFISEKLIAVAGDVSVENLGIKEEILKQEMFEEIDIVVHTAANTNFNERANLHGWPKTYSFTKAMTEKLLANIKDCLPVIIIRPTAILSTCSEPFPGWIEGVRNPFKLSNLQDIMYSYFSKNPWVNEDGKPVAIDKKIAYLSSIAEFVNCMEKRHVVPKDQVPGQSHRDININNYGEIERVMRMAELFQPYTFFQGIFHDKNAEELRMMAKSIADMDNGFNFNSKDMNWMDYMMNVHIPGLLKHSNKSVRNLAKL